MSIGSALSWSLVGFIVVLALGVVIGMAVRGRNVDGQRPGPAVYFFFGISLVCLALGTGSAGLTVHSISKLVGPAPQSFDFPSPPIFPPCSTQNSSVSTTTVVPTPPEPCTNYAGNSGVNSSGNSSQIGMLYSPAMGTSVATLDSGSSTGTNRYISDAIAAGLFTIMAWGAFLLVWPRSRRSATGLGSDVESRIRTSYGYLVSALAALATLVFVPLAADNVFRAIAPGVAQTGGHANGVRGVVTFTVLAGISAAILVYHLRYAGAIARRSTDFDGEDDDPVHD